MKKKAAAAPAGDVGGSTDGPLARTVTAKPKPASGGALKGSGGPKIYTCYMCGQGFSGSSLGIHQPKCQQKWLAEQAGKPAGMGCNAHTHVQLAFHGRNNVKKSCRHAPPLNRHVSCWLDYFMLMLLRQGLCKNMLNMHVLGLFMAKSRLHVLAGTFLMQTAWLAGCMHALVLQVKGDRCLQHQQQPVTPCPLTLRGLRRTTIRCQASSASCHWMLVSSVVVLSSLSPW